MYLKDVGLFSYHFFLSGLWQFMLLMDLVNFIMLIYWHKDVPNIPLVAFCICRVFLFSVCQVTCLTPYIWYMVIFFSDQFLLEINQFY
jgi:hypothetical protein